MPRTVPPSKVAAVKGGLQPESIGDVITRAGERAGIEIRLIGHSLRLGLAMSPGSRATTRSSSPSRETPLS
ncbi:hypothetical protein [Streptomyces sp. NBC_00038]|uniref:hypothetical protein n=1 Tax=Streptomyces sp. NBC_00038 TaxID=2903615 RepID=UPI0022524EE7|nr:hypothetical protein [Streptomyces sp. NBC_00038]MCX5562890.1 hypothetical protein [Streptomyces sp. NBC_00038]